MELPLEQRAKHWVAMFASFDKTDEKALRNILGQKQRLQVEMQSYLGMRKKSKVNVRQVDTPVQQQRRTKWQISQQLSVRVDPLQQHTIDEKIGGLRGKVHRLKHVAQVIEGDTKLQNELLTQLESTMLKAQPEARGSHSRRVKGRRV